jgi:hypothetical protein
MHPADQGTVLQRRLHTAFGDLPPSHTGFVVFHGEVSADLPLLSTSVCELDETSFLTIASAGDM